jgi:hypothetical protein
MMRPAARQLTEADVRGAARRALRPDVEVTTSDSPDPGTTRAFVIVLNGSPGFFVIDAGRPYSDDVDIESKRFEDPRAREAYAAPAWIAVDSSGRAAQRNAGVSAAGKLAAGAGRSCTLLYAPTCAPGPRPRRYAVRPL